MPSSASLFTGGSTRCRPSAPNGTPATCTSAEVGDWLAINGEAIYGTRPWRIHGEGPTQVVDGAFTETRRPTYTGRDIRFMTREDTLYAIALAWPGEQMQIRSLGAAAWDGKITRIDLLGSGAALNWRQDPDALIVALPDHQPCEHAFALRITPA